MSASWRERLLRTTGSSLEVAGDRAAILAAATDALWRLLDGVSRPRIYISLGSAREQTIVVAEGEGATELLGRTLDVACIRNLPEHASWPVRPSILQASARVLTEIWACLAMRALLIPPVMFRSQWMGLVVRSDAAFPERVNDALAVSAPRSRLP